MVVAPQQYGAKADGVANDTAAVRAAAAACASHGGCILAFRGGAFLTGPFRLPNATELLVDEGASIVAAPRSWWEPAGWTGAAQRVRGMLALISAEGAEDVVMRGSGSIVGQGEAWYKNKTARQTPGLVMLQSVRRLRIGSLHFINSPDFNLLLMDCVSVRVTGINISAPHDSPNTDGVDFGGGSDLSVTDSVISNGDDCVSVVASSRTGPPHPGHWPAESFGGSVVVRNLTCIGSHGVSVGSVRHGVVTNVTVEDVRFVGSGRGWASITNGCRIKTYGALDYRTAARTLFPRPYLAHFCSFFRHSFAVFSVLTPGFQKVAPNDRGSVLQRSKTAATRVRRRTEKDSTGPRLRRRRRIPRA